MFHIDAILFQKNTEERTIETTQTTITVMYDRFKVTTSLYLSPSSSARSLSSLIAVSVNKDTEHNM